MYHILNETSENSMKKLTLKAARLVGTVQKGNAKIHGSTFSTDPLQCNVGAKLVNIENSTCSNCYALKLRKVYPSAAQSWSDNLSKFRQFVEDDNVIEWCESIAHQINSISALKTRNKQQGANFHRWFTAGDIDSLEMLRAIIKVCELTPTIKHWLPTREVGILREYANVLGMLPLNLTIRVSDTKVDNGKSITLNMDVVYSSVHSEKVILGKACPAIEQGGNCNDCSMCWDNTVDRISYKKH